MGRSTATAPDPAMLIIRPAVPADAPTVHRLIRAIAEYQGDGASFTATVEDVARDGFGPESCYSTLLAELDGRVAGLASFFPTYSTFRGRPCLYLDNLYVEAECRRRGVARALLARVAGIARIRGCYRVDLHVREGNDAETAYRRVGFEPSGSLAMSLMGEALRQLATENPTAQ